MLFPASVVDLTLTRARKEGYLQALRPEEKDRLGFERELLKYIDKLMLELNTKVRRNEERLAKENVPVIGIDDQVCTFPTAQLLLPCV